MAQFFSRLSYSLGNEDCRTEHEALKIKPGDKVVCITASGDRPLHLLLADVGEIVTVDANPCQNHLFLLKKTALQELSYDRYAAFLGVEAMDDRLAIWETMREKLPDDSRLFWDQRWKMIEEGVLYQGSLEKWCTRGSKLFKFWRGKKIDKLFGFCHIEDQKEFLAEWETTYLKKAFDLFLHPAVTRVILRDPGLYENLGEGIRAGEYVYQKFHNYLRRHLAKDSLLASLVLRGKANKESLPPYLSRLGAALIRSRLGKISYEDLDILSYLKKQPDSSIDIYSLSDIASYIDKESFGELAQHVVRTAKPGARFCMRQFLSKQEIPEEFSSSIQRDPELEKRLEEEDRCFVYRFTVGTVVK